MRFLAALVVVVAVVPLLLARSAMSHASVAAVGTASVPSAVVVGESGYTNGCVVFSGGSVKCWGYNGYGQLGTGSDTTAFSATPMAVKGISSAKAVSIVRNATCVLLSGGTVKCWGDNALGELGNGTTTTDSLTPVAVKGISSARALSGGFTEACALLSGGTVECWGINSLGELGNGATGANSPTPVAVKGISSAKAVSAGGDGHACALLSGGAVDCWGNNVDGQLGNGPTATNGGFGSSLLPSSTPVAVKGISSAIGVSTGSLDSCALLSGGTVECWGNNDAGQLGNGTISTDSPTPVAVKGLSGVKAVSTGGDHACALLFGGAVDCWGDDAEGQLGNGTTAGYSPTPVAVKGISTAKAISGAEGTTCALLSGGIVKCWGRGSGGALGDGANTNHSTPVAVRFIAPTRKRP